MGLLKHITESINGFHENISKNLETGVSFQSSNKDYEDTEELDISSIGNETKTKDLAKTIYGDGAARNTRKCPFCGHIFEKEPTRGKKCPKCQKQFLVRSNGRLFSSKLLSPEQAYASDLFDVYMGFGVTFEFSESVRDRLKASWGQIPKESDLLWQIANLYHLKEAKTLDDLIQDTSTRQYLFYNFARYDDQCGRDPRVGLRASAMCSLRKTKLEKKYFGENDEYVYISANHCCETCRQRDGKKIKISVAEKEEILPFKDCKNRLNPNSKYPFCVAEYTSRHF